MEDETKNIKGRIKSENGLVIVEAAIVFPVMFFVLFFIIFAGNMYYEQAKIDKIVMVNAIKGAQYVTDPYLSNIDKGESIPTQSDEMKVEPYRYIFSGTTIAKIEDELSENVKKEISDGGLIFFSNSRANVIGSDNEKIAKYNNYVVYSTFVVQVNYEVNFPISFFGATPTAARLSSRAEVSVNDAPEFIRNVDMVVDMLDGTSTAKTIKGFFDKINTFINKFAAK